MSATSSNNNKTKKCLSCKPTDKSIANTTKKRADWKSRRGLKTIFPNDQIPDLKKIKQFHPSNANEHVRIELGKKFANRYILFYAAKKRHVKNCEKILSPDKAYTSFKNRGVSKTNKDGVAILKLKCPQTYSEKGKVYFSHVHFIISDEKNKKWINELKTQQVVCQVRNEDLFDILDSGSAVVLNALPIEYFVKDRIPSSFSLPHDLVLNKITEADTIQYIRSCIQHNKKLKKAVDSQKLDVLNVPIVTYCYDNTCEADTDLQKKLNKIGFTNVKVYGPGIKGFRKSFGPGK
jgi:rhodanese-related sulfurtransferase